MRVLQEATPPQEARHPWAQNFRSAEEQHGLPSGLLEVMAEVESQFDPNARSGAGAVGLMQIVPRWHPDVDPTDPEASIDYAGRYMSELYGRFGDWEHALAAYNAGPSRVREYGGVPPFQETQDYVSRIGGAVDLGPVMGERQREMPNLLGDIERMRTQQDAARVEEPRERRTPVRDLIGRMLEGVEPGLGPIVRGETPVDDAFRQFESGDTEWQQALQEFNPLHGTIMGAADLGAEPGTGDAISFMLPGGQVAAISRSAVMRHRTRMAERGRRSQLIDQETTNFGGELPVYYQAEYRVPSGESIHIQTTYRPRAGELHINWVGNEQVATIKAMDSPSKIGAATMREILSDLFEVFPSVQRVKARRVSGTRSQGDIGSGLLDELIVP